MTKNKCSCQWWNESQPTVNYKTGIGFSMWTACFSIWSGWTFSSFVHQSDDVFLSQVNFSFWSVGRGRGGWELRGYAQGHLLWGAVLTGVVTTVGIGTAGGRKARPVLLATQPGAPVSQASQAPSFLVRHEGGEFRGVPGLAYGGGMPGHPAGVWVAQFAALGCTVSGHCHIREGADICGQERASWW